MARHLQIFSSVGGTDVASLVACPAALAADGWTVETVSAIGTAEYRQARTPWQRLAVRWRMYPGFAVRLVLACWRRPGAVRIVTTNPFFAPWLAAVASGRRGKTIMLAYDLYPEALEVGRPETRRRLSHRCVAAITRGAIRRCDAVVYLGERIKAHADARYGPARRAAVIPVAADGSVLAATPAHVDPAAPVEILYCGRLGRMHDVETLRALFTASPPQANVRFVFHASGQAYEQLRGSRDVKTSPWQVQWGEPLPPSEWAGAIAAAPVGLITLRPGAEAVSMPSKLVSGMAAGQAILAVAPADSDLADVVRATGCGWVVEPGDARGLQERLAEIATDREALGRKRANARGAAAERFAPPVVHEAWRKLLAALGEP